MQPLLTIQDLSAGYGGKTVIRDISLTLMPGEILGVVGESGSGKTTLLKAVSEVKGLRTDIYTGTVTFNGEDLLHMEAEEKRKRQGEEIAYVFQHPGDSLNPTRKVRVQFYETILAHRRMEKKEMDELIASVFKRIGLTDVERILNAYPFELSGGMSQRVMIAMAIACRPKLLIADEPTTALDVTIQAQIIELLLDLQQQENMALVLITHDLALVAEAAYKIIVMYAGQVVETGDAKDIFRAPRHPYTQALLRALPEFAQDKARLASLPGVVPGKYDRPVGCLLNPRCPYATDKCRSEEPALADLTGGRQSKCHYPLDDAGRPGL